jgi:hypothetical protein
MPEAIRRGFLGSEPIGISLGVELEPNGPVVEVDALDVIEDGGEGFKDVGFAAAIAPGEAVWLKFETTLIVITKLEAPVPVPVIQKIDFKACCEAAEIDTKFESKQFHARG